jgi:hypothetical protein
MLILIVLVCLLIWLSGCSASRRAYYKAHYPTWVSCGSPMRVVDENGHESTLMWTCWPEKPEVKCLADCVAGEHQVRPVEKGSE